MIVLIVLFVNNGVLTLREKKWEANFIDFDVAIERIRRTDSTFIDFNRIGILECEGKVLDLLKKNDFFFYKKMGVIDIGYFLDMSSSCLMIKIWEHFYHVHHFPRPNPSSCNCSIYLDLCIDVLREVYHHENYIYFDNAVYKFQFYGKKYICFMSTKNGRYKEQIVKGILRGERFFFLICRLIMVEKLIFHKKRYLIQCI